MESSAHRHLPIDIAQTDSVPFSPRPNYPIRASVFLTGPLETELPQDAENEDPADVDGGLGVDSFIHRIASDFFSLRSAGSPGLSSFAPQFLVDSLYTTEQVASILQTAPHFVLEGAGNMAYVATRAELDFYRQENRRLNQMLERALTNANTLFRAHGWIHLDQAIRNEFASANRSQEGGTSAAVNAPAPAGYHSGAGSAGFHASVNLNSADMTHPRNGFSSDSRDNAADKIASQTGYNSAAGSAGSGYGAGYGTTVDSIDGGGAVGSCIPVQSSNFIRDDACGCDCVSVAIETKHGHKLFEVFRCSEAYAELLGAASDSRNVHLYIPDDISPLSHPNLSSSVSSEQTTITKFFDAEPMLNSYARYPYIRRWR
ncbi:hypothetical protein C8R43DRAFT_954952 [Mycena crocata]|nr:hypothetical protein C8R43DRAFT_954952 [Mycena crocata]